MKKVWRNLEAKFYQTSKSITSRFYQFDDISLKLYLEIVRSLDYKRLLISGDATVEECQQQWDKIIERCSISSGGLDFVNFIDMSKQYGILLSEYNIVKGWLSKLWFQVDDQIIEQLVERGYNIITTKQHPKYDPQLYLKFESEPKENLSINYRESILTALQRSEHLVTKIKMKANELHQFMDGHDGGRKEMLFDEIMAQLLVRGIKVEDNITLSRYIELLKVLNTKTQEVNG